MAKLSFSFVFCLNWPIQSRPWKFHVTYALREPDKCLAAGYCYVFFHFSNGCFQHYVQVVTASSTALWLGARTGSNFGRHITTNRLWYITLDGSVFTSLARQTGVLFNTTSGPRSNPCLSLRQAVECVPCCTTLIWPLKFRTQSWKPSPNGHINKTLERPIRDENTSRHV